MKRFRKYQMLELIQQFSEVNHLHNNKGNRNHEYVDDEFRHFYR
jgi:hypothetical protein